MKTGSCLCGAVKIVANGEAHDLGACHCAICRKWAGGPFLEIECGVDVAIEGGENVATFRSSEWAERGFCNVCGSHLFIRAIDSGEYGIPPGLFDADADIRFNRQVFIDQKPGYYSFSDATKKISSDYIYERFPAIRGK